MSGRVDCLRELPKRLQSLAAMGGLAGSGAGAGDFSTKKDLIT
ncbi:MAG: hypothetical protein NTX50_24565 [Candidatus Sumerlaeota bacterium]|nr:hypothetical protein [Candidatus Sumerlaeota bacterium]